MMCLPQVSPPGTREQWLSDVISGSLSQIQMLKFRCQVHRVVHAVLRTEGSSSVEFCCLLCWYYLSTTHTLYRDYYSIEFSQKWTGKPLFCCTQAQFKVRVTSHYPSGWESSLCNWKWDVTRSPRTSLVIIFDYRVHASLNIYWSLGQEKRNVIFFWYYIFVNCGVW